MKKWWIFIIIIVILILGLIVYWQYKHHLDYSLNSKYCERQINLDGKDSCWNSLAIKEKNVEYCNKISSNSWQKKDCYTKLVELTEDLKICDLNISEDFELKCIHTISKAQRNKSVCDMAKTNVSKEYCLSEYNRMEKIYAECGKIQDKSQEENCFFKAQLI